MNYFFFCWTSIEKSGKSNLNQLDMVITKMQYPHKSYDGGKYIPPDCKTYIYIRKQYCNIFYEIPILLYKLTTLQNRLNHRFDIISYFSYIYGQIRGHKIICKSIMMLLKYNFHSCTNHNSMDNNVGNNEQKSEGQ